MSKKMSYKELEENFKKILEENRRLKEILEKKELFEDIRREKLSSDIF